MAADLRMTYCGSRLTHNNFASLIEKELSGEAKWGLAVHPWQFILPCLLKEVTYGNGVKTALQTRTDSVSPLERLALFTYTSQKQLSSVYLYGGQEGNEGNLDVLLALNNSIKRDSTSQKGLMIPRINDHQTQCDITRHCCYQKSYWPESFN